MITALESCTLIFSVHLSDTLVVILKNLAAYLQRKSVRSQFLYETQPVLKSPAIGIWNMEVNHHATTPADHQTITPQCILFSRKEA